MNITFFFLPNFYFLDTPFLNLIIHFHKKEQTKKEKEKKRKPIQQFHFPPHILNTAKQTNKSKPLTPLQTP